MLLNEEFEDKFDEFITWLAGEIEFSLAYPRRVAPALIPQPGPQPRLYRPYYKNEHKKCTKLYHLI